MTSCQGETVRVKSMEWYKGCYKRSTWAFQPLVLLLYLCGRFIYAQDWYDQFDGPTRTLNGAGQQDPRDPRVTFRGSGQIIIGNGMARFRRSPRMYISNPQDANWNDVEMTGYATFLEPGGTTSRSSGFTMAARSNHDLYQINGCEAFGYYARIVYLTGECLFTKEYFHGSNYTVYAPSIRVPCFPSGLPVNQTIGMKFTVVTIAETGNVQLQLFTDLVGDGSWVLRHEYIDEPGKWTSSSSASVPLTCPQNDGDTVLRPGNVCFLRADGTDASIVQWTNASILNNIAFRDSESPSASPSTFPLATTEPSSFPTTMITTEEPSNVPSTTITTKSPSSSPSVLLTTSMAPSHVPSFSNTSSTPTAAPGVPTISNSNSSSPSVRPSVSSAPTVNVSSLEPTSEEPTADTNVTTTNTMEPTSDVLSRAPSSCRTVLGVTWVLLSGIVFQQVVWNILF